MSLTSSLLRNVTVVLYNHVLQGSVLYRHQIFVRLSKLVEAISTCKSAVFNLPNPRRLPMSTLPLPKGREQWLSKVTICALDGTSLLQTRSGSRRTRTMSGADALS